MNRPKTLGEIILYIREHGVHFGYEPTAIAVNKKEWDDLIEEFNAYRTFTSLDGMTQGLGEPLELYVRNTKIVYDPKLN